MCDHHDGHCHCGCRGEHHHHHHGEGGHGGGRDERRGGPEGTEFLQLEMSRVMYGEAQAMSREAMRDLLREAIRERLRQRVGDRLRAVGVLVADELAEELEANLAIEQRIDAQKRRKREIDETLRALFETNGPPKPADEG